MDHTGPHIVQPPPRDPYQGLRDEEVLARAAKALRKVNQHPVGSPERSLQWALFESAKAELDMRLARHILDAIERKRTEKK